MYHKQVQNLRSFNIIAYSPFSVAFRAHICLLLSLNWPQWRGTSFEIKPFFEGWTRSEHSSVRIAALINKLRDAMWYELIKTYLFSKCQSFAPFSDTQRRERILSKLSECYPAFEFKQFTITLVKFITLSSVEGFSVIILDGSFGNVQT